MLSEERKYHLFISYSSKDSSVVDIFLPVIRSAFEELGLSVALWIDRDNLQPGEQWERTIQKALLDSIGILVFVSAASMRSNWVRNEVLQAAAASDRLIIPVILESISFDLVQPLASRQWIDVRERPLQQSTVVEAAFDIARGVNSYLDREIIKPPVSQAEAPQVAEEAASFARGKNKERGETPPDSVFIVHGHDIGSLQLVSNFLKSLNIKPFVLSKALGPSQSLLQKFFQFSQEARFAIVIYSPDDFGASLLQYNSPGVADKALQFRARQNVVLELGFFYGFLGWENVFVLRSKPPDVFPNFELPSDLGGAVFDVIDDEGDWKQPLKKKLMEAGFTFVP